MKAKTVKILVEKIPSFRYKIEYICPKCKISYIMHSFYDERILRFSCDCGQEIIANYEVIK